MALLLFHSASGSMCTVCADSVQYGAWFGVPMVGGHLHPNPAIPGGEHGPGVGETEQSSTKFASFRPTFSPVPRTPSTSICPCSRDQVPCLREHPCRVLESTFQLHILSFESLLLLLPSSFLFLFLGSDEWTGPSCPLCLFGLVMSRCSHCCLGSVQGLCHAHGAWEFALCSLSDALQMRPRSSAPPSP